MATKTSKRSELSVSIQLKGIELLESCIVHPKQQISGSNVFHFDIKIEHKVSIEKNIIAVVASVDIFNENKDVKLGSLTSSCIFEIRNIAELVHSSNNQINLPEDMLISLNSITISTARGIMFNQFKGTFLHNAFLPIIDPTSFIIQ